MRKIKWGVMGTAYIFERDTARGMKLAENCELTAIAVLPGHTEAMRNCCGIRRLKRCIFPFPTPCIMSGP